jgi:hypothetical protein
MSRQICQPKIPVESKWFLLPLDDVQMSAACFSKKKMSAALLCVGLAEGAGFRSHGGIEVWQLLFHTIFESSATGHCDPPNRVQNTETRNGT